MRRQKSGCSYNQTRQQEIPWEQMESDPFRPFILLDWQRDQDALKMPKTWR